MRIHQDSFFWALRAFCLRAGYAPAGQLLFLACPSKSNQKEGHPAYRPQQKTLGVPCVARHAGWLRNSHVSLREALLEQVLADTPRHGCATRRWTGAPKNQANTSAALTARELIIKCKLEITSLAPHPSLLIAHA